MRGNRKRDTRPEVLIRSLLHREGYRFRKDLSIKGNGWQVRPDIVFPRLRLAVFVDGCFWHRCPTHGTAPRTNEWYWRPKLDRNVERDRSVDKRPHQAHWVVLRIWEHESPEVAAKRVTDTLRQLAAT
jgi:DNA mismatch endonuclease (patch repair protein)